MRTNVLAALTAAAALLPSPAFAWGKTGHRVVAAIADTQLSGLARAHVREILGPGESLDDAANWPDEMRSDPAVFWQKTATPWHYVTLNGITYDHAPPAGDALQALDHFRVVLQDPKANLADKQLALRFIVHLVGDLHQPLHVGKCCDKGGNDVKVTFFGKPTNLHAVWDSALPDEEQLSYSELAAKLERHLSDRRSSPGGTSTRATGSAKAASFATRSIRPRRTCRNPRKAKSGRRGSRFFPTSPIPTSTSSRR